MADLFSLRTSSGVRRLLSRAALKVLRHYHPTFRGYCDVFAEPYERWIDWKSGLEQGTWLLYSFVRALQPRVIVEIGSARGKSTCALALACKHNGCGRVVAIDPQIPNAWSELGTSGDNYTFLLERLREYGLLDTVEVLRATSGEVARGWTRPIDFLFIDGDHSYEGVRSDFQLFAPFLVRGAVVAFHDSAWEQHDRPAGFSEPIGVPRFLDELQRDGYQSVTFPRLPGLTLLDPKPGGYSFLGG